MWQIVTQRDKLVKVSVKEFRHKNKVTVALLTSMGVPDYAHVVCSSADGR